MTEIYIIGTGGAAKEIIQLVEQVNNAKPSFEIKGFVELEPTSDTITFFDQSYSLLKESDFIDAHKGVAVIIAHGTASMRAKIYAQFIGFNFPNLIHPLVEIHASVKMGQGNIIKMGCLITTDINLGDNNYINRGVQIGHDVNLGNHNVLNPAAVISGGVSMGNMNNFGGNATILQYKKVGNNNTIGAGAVLANDTDNDKLLVGIPAKEKA